ncbi:hypothetical protein EI94DRAFT_1809604 [Lactarius quietus]|nr:hypothetical protein EI94DRAFT_1809604 [Lactarius quietus]
MSGPSGHYTDTFFNTGDDYGHPYYGHSGQNTLYDPLSSYPGPQHIDTLSSLPGSVFKAIMSASHDMLIRSGNAAYTSMHAQLVQAQCELEAERNSITRLQAVIDKLTMSRTPPIPMTSETGASNGSVNTLIISQADTLEALEQDDYPDVPYWHDSDWAQQSDRQKDCGKTVSKLGFLTDKGGRAVSESRIKEFMGHAKQVWNDSIVTVSTLVLGQRRPQSLLHILHMG